MSALSDRKPATITIYDVRFWDDQENADSSVAMYEDRAEARERANRGNGTVVLASRFYVEERVLHLRKS